jgi:uncharacterized membrane protein HdeD (DUF308 family)
MKSNNLNLIDRIQAPTPKWFRIVRSIGLIMATVGGALVASPVALPTALVSVAGYLVLCGGIISAVSQTAVQAEEEIKNAEKLPGNGNENIK